MMRILARIPPKLALRKCCAPIFHPYGQLCFGIWCANDAVWVDSSVSGAIFCLIKEAHSPLTMSRSDFKYNNYDIVEPQCKKQNTNSFKKHLYNKENCAFFVVVVDRFNYA